MEAPSSFRPPVLSPSQRSLVGLKMRRTDADEPAKHSGEMAGVLKPREDGSLQDTAFRITQRILRAFDPLLQQVTMGRAAHASLEQLGKMVSTHAGQCRELR